MGYCLFDAGSPEPRADKREDAPHFFVVFLNQGRRVKSTVMLKSFTRSSQVLFLCVAFSALSSFAFAQRRTELLVVLPSEYYVDDNFNYYYSFSLANQSDKEITSVEIDVTFSEHFPPAGKLGRVKYLRKIIQFQIPPHTTKKTRFFPAVNPPDGYRFSGIDVFRVRYSDGSILDKYSGNISSPHHTLGPRDIGNGLRR